MGVSDFAAAKSAWIKSAGNSVTILRSGGNVSTFGRVVKGRQLLSPYEINFVRFMVFPTDSGVTRGDLIQDNVLNFQAFVAAVDNHPQFGVNTAVYTELYLVNYPSIEVQRYSDPTVDDYGNTVPGTGGWNTVATLPMNVEHVNGNVPYKDGLLLSDTVFRCILQTSTPLQIAPNQDRIVIDGKPYAVSDINVSIAPGLQVAQVKTDTRT